MYQGQGPSVSVWGHEKAREGSINTSVQDGISCYLLGEHLLALGQVCDHVTRTLVIASCTCHGVGCSPAELLSVFVYDDVDVAVGDVRIMGDVQGEVVDPSQGCGEDAGVAVVAVADVGDCCVED